MVKSLCLGFLTCLVAGQAFAQFSERTPQDAASLNRLISEVTERSASVPEDPYTLYQEREWATEELNRIVRESSRKDPYQKSIERFEDLARDWKEFRPELSQMEPDSPLEEVKKLYARCLGLVTKAHNAGFRFDFEQSEEYEQIQEHFLQSMPARALPGLDLEPAVTEKNRELAVIAITAADLDTKMMAYLDFAKGELEARSEKLKAMAPLYREAQQKLEAYKKLLNAKISEVQAKENITANLFYMILVIGGLSVGAIALIRLFPDPVMIEWVASGQVIQFVTVMILLSCIMVLGLSGLLGENTIGTLLGGIGGYVLSQGVGRTVARRMEVRQSSSARNEG